MKTKLHHSLTITGTALWLLAQLGGSAAPADSSFAPAETPAQRDARMAWWRDARFGMFIHWGSVSLKGTEIGWSRGGERRGYGSRGNEVPVEVYDNLYKQFNPTSFNADQWVAIAKAAGMKYLVFTSRHHDGFSMFDTKASDYKITSPDSPFRRDVVRELAEACHRAGLRFGLYYSQPNWQHPDAFTPDRHADYLAYLKTQVRELLTQYGPVDVIWFDGLGKSAKDYDAVAMNQMIRELQPKILINNRNGLAEDFDTPEQRIGKFQNNRPWETCMTICQQWAWKPDDQMKSLQQCLQTLITCAGGDGNLLFNVGPMPDGRIEPRQVDRLKEMGDWLAKYGTSIYGTRGGPFKPGKWGASTYRGDTVYVHVFNWPAGGLKLPAVARKVRYCKVLTGGEASWKQSNEGISLEVPESQRQPVDTLIELQLDGPAVDIAPVALEAGGSGSLAEGKPATASNVFQKQQEYDAKAAFDGDEETRWATDSGTKAAWIEVDLGQPETFSTVVIDEWEGGERVRAFELQFRSGEEWKTFFTGTRIGQNWSRKLEPVTARFVRLNILDATDGPTINEIRLTR